MAQAPQIMPPPGPAAGDLMGGADLAAGDQAGAGGGDPGAETGGGETVVVTICKNDDGSYTVYPGDEPDAGGGEVDMSEDDAGAMGDAGGGGAMDGGMAGGSQGQPADSVGAALKAAMDIMNADKGSEGAPGNADDQLAAGYSASQSPTPATGPAQKY